MAARGGSAPLARWTRPAPPGALARHRSRRCQPATCRACSIARRLPGAASPGPWLPAGTQPPRRAATGCAWMARRLQTASGTRLQGGDARWETARRGSLRSLRLAATLSAATESWRTLPCQCSMLEPCPSNAPCWSRAPQEAEPSIRCREPNIAARTARAFPQTRHSHPGAMAAPKSVPPPTVHHIALQRMVFGEVDHSRFVGSAVSAVTIGVERCSATVLARAARRSRQIAKLGREGFCSRGSADLVRVVRVPPHSCAQRRRCTLLESAGVQCRGCLCRAAQGGGSGRAPQRIGGMPASTAAPA